jgi:hypothetical protein
VRPGHAEGRARSNRQKEKVRIGPHFRARDSTVRVFAATISCGSGKGRRITQQDLPDGAAATGVALLFREGTRPDAVAVRALARTGGFSVSHDPLSADSHDKGGDNWLELLINGLAFDLVGLDGGPSAPSLGARHRFGIEDAELGEVETIALVPGPHLSGGEAMLPIVRSQLALALQLATLPGLTAVGWAPAHSRMAADYFTSVASAWLEGGAFPALGLTALTPALDGGLHSDGLAFFTGQELRIEPDLAEDKVQATKLAVRLINQLVAQEAVDRRFEFIGLDGAPLLLEPSANGRFVRVRAAG